MNWRNPAPVPMPTHWSPQEALAVFEFLQALREQLWVIYGCDVQQAWRERIEEHHGPPPDFDPDAPF
jgi:hypothetical protein